ncbi:hypothetical protein LXL04_003768 [Taraxacum kok-saghyz]
MVWRPHTTRCLPSSPTSPETNQKQTRSPVKNIRLSMLLLSIGHHQNTANMGEMNHRLQQSIPYAIAINRFNFDFCAASIPTPGIPTSALFLLIQRCFN